MSENNTDLDLLETSLLSDIASASDEQAIEAVRVSALGKKGSISEQLKTLGAMTPEERKVLAKRIRERDQQRRRPKRDQRDRKD